MTWRQDWAYDQGEILDLKNKPHWPGICLSLSYDWCKRVLSGIVPKLADYEDITPERAMSQQRAYRGDARLTTLDWVTMLAKGDNLTVKAHDAAGFSGLTTKINLVKPGQVCVLGIYGHAVALGKPGDGTGLFFDPNYGQYKDTEYIGLPIVQFLNQKYNDDAQRPCQLRTLSGVPRDIAFYAA